MPYHHHRYAFVKNGGAVILPRPSLDIDFVGADGTLAIAPEVKAGYTAGSFGNSRLVQVHGGFDSSDMSPRLVWAAMKAGEIPIVGARRIVNAVDVARLTYSATWTPLISGVGSACTITANAGLNPDGSAGAVRVQASRPSAATGYAGLNFSVSAAAGVHPTNASVIATYWIRSYDGTPQTGVHLNAGGSGAGQRINITGTWTRYAVYGLATAAGDCSVQILTFNTDGNTNIDVLVATDVDHCIMSVNAWGLASTILQAPEQQHPSTDYGFGALGVKYYPKTSGLSFVISGATAGQIVSTTPVPITTVRGFGLHQAQNLSSAPTDTFVADFSSNFCRLDTIAGTTGPIQGAPVQKMVGTAGASTWWRMFVGATVSPDNWYVSTCVVKMAPIKSVTIQMYNATLGVLQYIRYNMNTKVMTLISGTTYPQNLATNFKVTDIKNGWFHIQIKTKIPTVWSGFLYCYLQLDYTDGQTAMQGDGVNGVYLNHLAIYPMGNLNAFLPMGSLIRSPTTGLTVRLADNLLIKINPANVALPAGSLAMEVDQDTRDWVTDTVNSSRVSRTWQDAYKWVGAQSVVGQLAFAVSGTAPNRQLNYRNWPIDGISKHVYTWTGPSGAIIAQMAVNNVYLAQTLAADASVSDGKIYLLTYGTERYCGTIRRFRVWKKALKDTHVKALGLGA